MISSSPPEAGQRPVSAELERRLGHLFGRPGLLAEALRHRSFTYEQADRKLADNERLEYLGDAVLELAVSALLLRRNPGEDEGRLTRLRAALVNEGSLSLLARRLALGPHLKLGRGEILSGGQDKPSILSNALEAVIGAVFLDAGFEAAARLVERLWEPLLERTAEAPALKDAKTRLQELIQERDKVTPRYRVVKSEGPDHRRLFLVEVRLGRRTLAQGRGGSKKEAEQDAAAAALILIRDGREGGEP